MKRLIALTAACAAFLIFTAAVAHATAGGPIQGTPILLQHDPPEPPEMVARGTTNGEGNITFRNLKPGNYTFVLADTSTLKVQCQVVVTVGREKLPVSAPIPPGKRGASANVLDRSGRKLTVVIDKAGGSITINVSSSDAAAGTLR